MHNDGKGQRQQNERQAKPFGHLGKLRIQRLSLALRHESLGAAGDDAGKAGALAGLHQNNQRNSKTGEQLKHRQNDFDSRHDSISSFQSGKIFT